MESPTSTHTLLAKKTLLAIDSPKSLIVEVEEHFVGRLEPFKLLILSMYMADPDALELWCKSVLKEEDQ